MDCAYTYIIIYALMEQMSICVFNKIILISLEVVPILKETETVLDSNVCSPSQNSLFDYPMILEYRLL